MIFNRAPLSFSTIAGDVPAGASTPDQKLTTKPGWASWIMVGTLDRAGNGSFVVTASARTRPFLI